MLHVDTIQNAREVVFLVTICISLPHLWCIGALCLGQREKGCSIVDIQPAIAIFITSSWAQSSSSCRGRDIKIKNKKSDFTDVDFISKTHNFASKQKCM